QARDLYLRALSTEPLSEVIYRSLMRCAHAQNDPSAAFSAYRRCRDTLSILLGRKPSEETDKLAISLGLLSSR
ncbi:MAG: bacterial transcriptional activator domain-containing protein, partial [Polaromonas sp.]|nr:bacterial transcriptional activator domain-containing protein [Polaromonas sp.]